MAQAEPQFNAWDPSKGSRELVHAGCLRVSTCAHACTAVHVDMQSKNTEGCASKIRGVVVDMMRTHSICVPWYLSLQTFLILNHNKKLVWGQQDGSVPKGACGASLVPDFGPQNPHKERTDSTELSSDIHMYTVVCTHPHTYIMHTYTAHAQLKTHLCMCSCVQMCTRMCFCGWSPEADVETRPLSESLTELELPTLARLADQ